MVQWASQTAFRSATTCCGFAMNGYTPVSARIHIIVTVAGTSPSEEWGQVRNRALFRSIHDPEPDPAFAGEAGRDTGDRTGDEVDAVTGMLERALAQLPKLPPPQQDEVAAWLLAEFEDEGRWAAALEDSQGTLEALADEALAEHRGGLTEPLDPEEL